MRLTKSSLGCIAVTLASVTWLGCQGGPPPSAPTNAPAATAAAPPPAAPNPGAGNSGVAQAGPPPGPATVPEKDCPATDFAIDDCEDNNNQVKMQGGRNGYWYTFADKYGTTISPPAHSKYLMSPGGSRDSKYGARMIGKVSKDGDPVYGGMGFSFTDPKGPYDASQYTGISFWAKVGPGSTKTVRLKVPDVNTDPDGKVCKECFNDFGADLTLTDQWKKYTIPFAAMKQMKDWGDPTPAAVNKSKLYGVQFQVNDSGANYDIWVDDLQFTGC
jgi:endoglucanase